MSQSDGKKDMFLYCSKRFPEYVQSKHTLISPSSTNKDDTKLYPWKEGVANAFLRRASVRKKTKTIYDHSFCSSRATGNVKKEEDDEPELFIEVTFLLS